VRRAFLLAWMESRPWTHHHRPCRLRRLCDAIRTSGCWSKKQPGMHAHIPPRDCARCECVPGGFTRAITPLSLRQSGENLPVLYRGSYSYRPHSGWLTGSQCPGILSNHLCISPGHPCAALSDLHSHRPSSNSVKKAVRVFFGGRASRKNL